MKQASKVAKMISNKTVSLIIPILNEEKYIRDVLLSLPNFIDYVILVNDGSTDNSISEARAAFKHLAQNNSAFIELQEDNWTNMKSDLQADFYIIHHSQNKGKGAAIKTGYKFASMIQSDCIVTIDGDGQMKTDEIEFVCMPIIQGEADYVKGNRLSYPNAKAIIPKTRLFGIYMLTFVTRIISGYWHINDTQTGFTAIHIDALKKIDLNAIYDYYGYVNDIIVKLSTQNARIVEVPITPIYSFPMDSKMKLNVAIPKISWLMLRLIIWKTTYKIKSFLNNF